MAGLGDVSTQDAIKLTRLLDSISGRSRPGLDEANGYEDANHVFASYGIKKMPNVTELMVASIRIEADKFRLALVPIKITDDINFS